jgi:hypothetical protein
MTDRDERLQALTEAVMTCGCYTPPYRETAFGIAVRFLAMIDAIRAFDEQRKEVMQHQKHHSGIEESPGCGPERHNATAPAVIPPVGADPPWLDEAAKIASDCYFGSAHCEGWPEVVRAVLAFAAAKARSGI